MVTLDEVLAQLQLEQQTANQELGAQIDASRSNRQADTAGLLNAISQQAAIENQAIADAPSLVGGGIAAVVDANNGTNFSRAAEALANQRALVGTGAGVGARAFNQNLNRVDGLQQRDNFTLQDELKLEQQIRRDEQKALKDQLDAQLKQQDLQQKSERNAIKAQTDQQKLIIAQQKEEARQREAADRAARDNRRLGIQERSISNRDTIARQNIELKKSKSSGSGEGSLKDLKPNEIDKITAFDTSRNIVSQFERLVSDPSNESFFGPIEGRSRRFNIFSQSDRNKSNGLIGSIDQLRQDLGKILEGGKLIGADEKKFERLLPTITDEPTVALQKLRNLLERLEVERNTKLTNLKKGGFNTVPFERERANLDADKTPESSASKGAESALDRIKRLRSARRS